MRFGIYSVGFPEKWSLPRVNTVGIPGEISKILNQLFENYHLDGVEMAYTMEDFQKDYVRDHLGVLSTDEILKRISLEEIQSYLEKQKKD